MRLVDYLDKGASLAPAAPCLTTDGAPASYAEVVDASHRIAAALRRRGLARRRQGGDHLRQRPARVHLRVRDQPGGRRVVPDQPTQRGRREPRAPRPLRLRGRASSRRRSRRWSRRSAAISRACTPGSGSTTTSTPADPPILGWSDFLDVGPARVPPRRRRHPRPTTPGHARRHRRHDRSSEGRDAQPRQPRDDDRADPDGLPLRRARRSTSRSRR